MIHHSQIKLSEFNVQESLAGALKSCSLNIQGEITIGRSRWDIGILDKRGNVAIVVEVKNANASLASAIKRENKLKRDEQGRRYQREAKQYGFKLFYCGGLYRIQPCVNEIMRYVWRRRILSVLGFGCWI